MAILLVEKYFDFARELADRFAVHGAWGYCRAR
jgi:ABC-type branched-subunit amino acid transport system ATPase component